MPDVLPTGETALWRAVILRAFQDATYGLHGAKPRRQPRRPNPTSRRHAGAARDWLMANGGFFRRVCDLAGLDPVLVRASAAISIASCDLALRERETEPARENGSFLAKNNWGSPQPLTPSV